MSLPMIYTNLAIMYFDWRKHMVTHANDCLAAVTVSSLCSIRLFLTRVWHLTPSPGFATAYRHTADYLAPCTAHHPTKRPHNAHMKMPELLPASRDRRSGRVSLRLSWTTYISHTGLHDMRHIIQVFNMHFAGDVWCAAKKNEDPRALLRN